MSRSVALLPSAFRRIGQYEWHEATHARRREVERQSLIEAQAEIRELLFIPALAHKADSGDAA